MRHRMATAFVAVSSLVGLAGGVPLRADALPATNSLASPSATGGAADGDSVAPDGVSVSGDGRYVVFESTASNLVANDTNGLSDVFVRDLVNGTTQRVSVDRFGGNANGASGSGRIAGGGRYVVFASGAGDLVADDNNGQTDVFVRDLLTATTTRVSVSSTGSDPNGFSNRPSISADGRVVAFVSSATNFGLDDGNDSNDIYVRDLVTATTTRASVDPLGADADGFSSVPEVSADGRFVAFASDAANLVTGDSNALQDVFVRDLGAGTTTRVSVSTTGGDPDGLSTFPSISGDGSKVAFRTRATNLVAGDTNGLDDIVVRDLVAATTTRVSVASGGAQANGLSTMPAMSADGTAVAFVSEATNLVASDVTTGPNGRDVFVRQLVTTSTTRASLDATGSDPDGRSQNPGISADGRVVAFASGATDLLATADVNSAADIYVRDRGPQSLAVGVGDATAWEADAGTVSVGLAVVLSAPAPAALSVPWSTQPSPALVGIDGSAAATADVDFVSASGVLTLKRGATAGLVTVKVKGDALVEPDERFTIRLGSTSAALTRPIGTVTIRNDDLGLGRISADWITTDADGPNANQASANPHLSGDGRIVAFESASNDLVDGDGANTDVFVRDRGSLTTRRVSVGREGGDTNGDSTGAAIDGDGNVVAFTSTASNLLVGNDGNGKADVFVRDLTAGTTTIVSRDAGGGDGNGVSSGASISADGTVVAFTSTSSDLVATDPNAKTADVFVRNLVTGALLRIGGSTAAEGATTAPALSADGRFVAVTSTAPLGPGDGNALADVYRIEIATGTAVRVSLDTGGGNPNGASDAASVSADGSVVAFQSDATDLVAGDGNAATDVFVRTMANSNVALVSASPGGAVGSGASTAPAITADGGSVAFTSLASNLLSGPDTNGAADVFLRSVGPATTVRLSLDATAGDPDGPSVAPTIDATGQTAAFATTATDILVGDTNGVADVVAVATAASSTPRLTVGDSSAPEGNAKKTKVRFTISLSQPATAATAIPWRVVAGSATTPADLAAASGTVTVAIGSTTATVDATVVGETTIESDETFTLRVTAPAGVAATDLDGAGRILGDDLP